MKGPKPRHDMKMLALLVTAYIHNVPPDIIFPPIVKVVHWVTFPNERGIDSCSLAVYM